MSKECPRNEQVQRVLNGIESYNKQNIPLLEKYLAYQVSNRFYDGEANLALLKLYQFYPEAFKPDIVKVVLIKAISTFPSTDFALCKYLIKLDRLAEAPLANVVELGMLLETCEFLKFWDNLQELPDVPKSVPDFEECVRKFIAYVVGITYQRIPRNLLARLLNFPEQELSSNKRGLAQFISECGWKETMPDSLAAGGSDSLASASEVWVEVNGRQADSVRTTSIREKVSFEALTTIAGAFRPGPTAFYIKSSQ